MTTTSPAVGRPVQRLFVANRGEIAVRIIRAAREMELVTILGVSEPDRTSYAASLADEVVVVGPASATKSYLSRSAVLEAALRSRADAVHPGYGFLSEDADFAESVADSGLVWVGPSATVIRLMGDKAAARATATAAGVPVVMGSEGVVSDYADLAENAARLGYPILIKASAGGGGRGIRIVRSAAELKQQYTLATAEAGAAFGDPSVYVEQFIEKARHVEVQILGDGVDAIHLFDRDCSIQRRQQKIVEEAPASDVDPAAREQMLTSAVHLARSCGYSGAGTVEFLYDVDAGRIFFIEMNTRLQVEHPITEAITGIDLVRAQLELARGGSLQLRQDDVYVRGHAIEVRINAEDPRAAFLPSPGKIDQVTWPSGPGVRVDSGFTTGSVVSPYYDSLLGKIIAWDEDRPAAIRRLLGSLDEFELDGVATTKDFVKRVLVDPSFVAFEHHTKFIEEHPTLLDAQRPT